MDVRVYGWGQYRDEQLVEGVENGRIGCGDCGGV